VLDILQDRWLTTKHDKAGNVIRARRLLQRGVYCNDRQVREKHVWHSIDLGPNEVTNAGATEQVSACAG
jgi:hypothetical protein